MHRKRVTSELHESYFRLMTIKHAIPKIEWAIEWAIELLYNSVKTGSQWVGVQMSWRSDELGRWVGDQTSWRKDVVGKATTQQKGPPGPRWSLETRWWQDAVEKARTQQSGLLGLRLSSPGEREGHNADDYKSGGQYIAVLFGLQLPLTIKTWVTLFRTLTIKWEVLIFLKKSSFVFIHCVNMYYVYMYMYYVFV